MYKKNALLFALLCTSMQYASDVTPWLEIKPSYFLFYKSPTKNIYTKGAFEIQASTSVPLHDYLDFYGSIGCRHASGYALNTHEKTSLTVVPLDIGLKPIFNVDEHCYYFFAMGPRFFYFQQKNQSPYIDHVIKSGGVGLFVNTGITVLFSHSFLFGLFTEYSYEKKSVSPKKPNVFSNGRLQMGGFAVGLSLGYAF